MTREEIDAIYDAQQNTNTVNNTGITREEIDAIFDAYESRKGTINAQSVQSVNAPVISPGFTDEDIVDMNGNVTKAKSNTSVNKQKPSFISKAEQQRRIADAQAIKEKKAQSEKQAEFARNNFQKTNEVLSGTGIPKGMTKNDVEIQKLYNEMNSTKNPNIKRNLQRTIDEKERVANQTLVSDDADEKEISSALAKWASSGYKMTSEEKKNARKLFGNGFKEGIDMNILSDEDKNNLAVAYSKSNPIQNFMAGFADNPAFKTFSNIYTKYADVTEEERASLEASDELTRRMIENAYTQQPIVTSGGKLAGSITEYAIGSKVIGALPGVGTATNKAGQAIGKGAEKALGTLGLGMADAGSKGVANLGTKLLSGGAQRAGQAIGNSASNIIGDSLVDVALDTVPNALNDAKNGANGKEVGINAAKNLAANIGFNAVGEAAQVIPYLGMNMKNYGRNDNAYAESMENISKRNQLNPLEIIDNNVNSNNSNNEKYTLSQIVESVSKKSDKEISDPVEKAFKDPSVGLTHTPEQLKKMQEYYNATNDNIVKYAISVKESPKGTKFGVIDLGGNGDNAVNRIKQLTGIDTTGNTTVIDSGSVIHTEKRHGKNGTNDHSMSDDKSFGRIEYVLHNYDNIYLGKDTTRSLRTSDGKQAPTVVFVKKIDGHYYGVEAVTDAKSKTNRIVSAFIGDEESLKRNIEKGSIIPMVNADDSAHAITSDNASDIASFDYSISNSAEKVNTPITDYKKVKINNHDDFNSQIDKYVGMYGDDAAKQKAVEVKEAMNKVLADNSDEAWEDAIKKTQELDNMLQGKSYTYKRKNGKNRNYQQQSTYNGEIASAFNKDAESIASEALENTSNKVNDVDPNLYNDSGRKVSKIRENTLKNSGIVTERELDKHFTKEQLSYIEIPEKESLEQAAIRLEQDSDGWKRKLMDKDSLSGMDTDTLMMIYRDTVNAARSTNDEKLWSDASAIFKKIQKSSTNSAQALQALSKWSKNTPEGALLGIQNQLSQLVDKKYVKGYADTVNNLADKVESIMNSGKSAEEIENEVSRLLKMDLQFFADKSYKNNVTGMKVMGSDKIMQAIRKGKSAKEVSNLIRKRNGLSFISDSDSRLIYDYLSAAQGLDANSREYKELLGKAGKIVANNIPSSLGEKAKSILYDNMLGNIKTALTRNMLGNAAYNALEQVRQLPAAGIDWVISKKTGNRTTTGWNKEKTLAYLSGLKKGFTDQVLDIKNGVNTSKSGFATLEDAISNNKHAFKNPLLKLQNGIDNIVHYGMSFGDRPFYEASYAQAKVELQQIINKYGESALQTNIYDTKTIDEFIDTAAKCRALESVFQNDGKIAKSLNSIKKGIGELSDGLFGVDILSQTSSPFTFTPGNMISKAVEYSPFGVIKNAVGTGKEISKRSFNQRRFVDETSRNLMGTGLFGGAIAAYNADLISGGYSSDPDAKTTQIASGEKEYALKLPNGGRIDIGDIPVLGPMAEAGARYVDAYKSGDNIIDASKKAMESIVGGSAIQGFNKVFGSNAYYETGGGVIDNIENTVKSAGTQLVPALLRQTAQTTDNYKRDLGEYGTNQYYINSIKNQIPVVRQTLPIKKDNEGIPVLQNQGRGMASKIFENYLSPLEYSKVQESDLGAEARRIAETTGSNAAYAPTAERSTVRDLEKKGYINAYSEDVYRNYKDELGTLVHDMAGELIDTDFYNSLSDEYKTKALEDTYTAMRAVAKNKISNGKYTTDNKIAKEYMKGGTQAAFAYMQNKYALSGNGISSNSKTAKAFYENGGEEALDVYSELMKNATNEQGKLDTTRAIQYLDGTNKSDAEKGEYIYMINNSSNAAKGMTSAYNDYGYEGVYDYYKIKSEAVNFDKSGSPTNLAKEAELIPYLTGRTDLTNEQKNDYVNYFFPKNKNTYF